MGVVQYLFQKTLKSFPVKLSGTMGVFEFVTVDAYPAALCWW